MDNHNETSSAPATERKLGCLHILGLLIVAMVISALISAWAIKIYIFPSEFEPVTLNAKEEHTLSQKLSTLGVFESNGSLGTNNSPSNPDTPLTPEPYSEKGAEREILLNEKELNALLAKNTNLAKKLAVDLSDNLVSAKLLVPMEEDFPILGGKTLRLNAGLKLDYSKEKPVIIVKGVSIMGVPIPNAWMGGIKNIDLVEQFGGDQGFWKSFSEGVEYLHVEEGRLKIKLKE